MKKVSKLGLSSFIFILTFVTGTQLHAQFEHIQFKSLKGRVQTIEIVSKSGYTTTSTVIYNFDREGKIISKKSDTGRPPANVVKNGTFEYDDDDKLLRIVVEGLNSNKEISEFRYEADTTYINSYMEFKNGKKSKLQTIKSHYDEETKILTNYISKRYIDIIEYDENYFIIRRQFEGKDLKYDPPTNLKLDDKGNWIYYERKEQFEPVKSTTRIITYYAN